MKDKIYRIIIGGDLLPSSANIKLFEEGNIEALFGKELCQLFADADFSIVNLEGVLTESDDRQEKAAGPSLKAPRKTIKGIYELGVKAVALANNHVTDYGSLGCCNTIETLKNSGIQYVGAGDSISNIQKSLTIEFGDQKICIYNVSETFFVVPDEKTAGANLYDEWIVLNEIKKLKEKHDYLIVIYHGGAEYLPYPTPQTRTRFHRMAECGADFITAQHTHCIGCEEWYHGSYLLYGQGNFLFAGQKKYPRLTKEGLVTELLFSENDVKIKHHIVNIVGNVLQYDTAQDFTSFKERSARIDDQDFIMDEFMKIKVDDVMTKFLAGLKGQYPFRRLLSKLFPKTMKKFVGRSFTKRQTLLNYFIMRSDRAREDMLAIWQYVLPTNR